MQSVVKRWWEAFCFLLFFLLVAYQIFPPPVTGLANNSDFSYVLGKLAICPADREQQNNQYLVTDYFYDDVNCYYDFGVFTIETPLVIVATWLSRPFVGARHLDLRALAALHFALLLAAFAILLSLTRRASPALRYGLPVLFILIFSDIAYTGYLNSVYLDAPAYVLLLATTACAAAACLNHRSQWAAAGFLLFGAAMIFAKSQHLILGLIFAALAIVLAFRPARWLIRAEWLTIAALLAGSAVTMASLTPDRYQLFALYNVIFARLAAHSDAPWEVIYELGLGEDDMKLINTEAYVPGVPVYNDQWSQRFLERTSFSDVLLFYLRHPAVPLREMNDELIRSTPVLRPTDMPNYRQKDGYPPKTMATRFSLWSDLRSAALRLFPYQLLLLYLAPWVAWALSWKKTTLRSPLMPLALAISVAGILEFSMATLTDAMDTSRHLFMFQVITEIMILMLTAFVLARFTPQARLTPAQSVVKSERVTTS